LYVNRKVRKLALKSALSLKAQNNELIIVDTISLEKYSTKAVLQICQNLKLVDNKTLLITKVADEMIVKSASNIAKLNVIAASSLNIYDLLHANKLLITLEALVNIEGVLA
jgi:large subunit ribosomal protein L4